MLLIMHMPQFLRLQPLVENASRILFGSSDTFYPYIGLFPYMEQEHGTCRVNSTKVKEILQCLGTKKLQRQTCFKALHWL